MNIHPTENRAISKPSTYRSALPDSEKQGEILFRGFRPNEDDEQQMRELVFNNAFLGRPFDVICPCKQWFGDVVLTPYIKFQQENVLVAIEKDTRRLIGYLTGSLGGLEFEKKQYEVMKNLAVSLGVALSMPWNLFEHACRLFLAHVVFKGERERPMHPPSGAHWHFQVNRDFRGQGVGTALLRRFVREAIDADFELIWAEVNSYPEKPPEYFLDRGWSIYDARPTEIFRDKVDFPVQTLCITRPLSSLAATMHFA